jgi:hypothetical protein
VPKPLNSIHLRAASLIAEGKTESEVAAACGKSRSWVQELKRREDFQAAIEEARKKKEVHKKELQQFQKEVFQEKISEVLDDWIARQSQLREQEWQISQKLLLKAQEMLEFSIEERRWNFRDACQFLEVASKIGRLSTELWQSDLNAAIQVVLRHGYEVIDTQQSEYGESSSEIE